MKPLNGVLIIPTGLGCALGGDAAYNPGVKLIANCVDNLIVNPNSVNASDINELPPNALYVEGSTIDRFLEGEVNLSKVKTFNRILMAVNNPISPASINSMNAGIWGLGANVSILTLNTPVTMTATFSTDGTASGVYTGIDELVKQVEPLDFDALALQTPIDCDPIAAQNYFEHGGINPWGGIEALVSKAISTRVNKPVAHAPSESIEEGGTYAKIIVKQSMAPEIISNTYTFCILKGLHRSPRLEFDLSKSHANILNQKDIDFLLTPHGCWGRPHYACVELGIPIIIVRENTTCFSNGFEYPSYSNTIFVNNYLEAAGVISAMGCGVDYRTILLQKQ